ncbi:MAG: aspartate/glutamate racemase family protein [Bacteroidota bacterium]
MDFYKARLRKYGIEAIIPGDQVTRDYVQDTIKNELGVGIIKPETKSRYISIVNDLVNDGAECLILGCTEIPLLISQLDFEIPVFDTAKIHTQAIVNYALN